MSGTIIDILLIAYIVVSVIDVSGIIQEMEESLGKWLKIRAHIPKPFSCSYCMTHHISVVYLLAVGEFTLVNWCIVFTVAYFCPVYAEIMGIIRDWLTWLLRKVSR